MELTIQQKHVLKPLTIILPPSSYTKSSFALTGLIHYAIQVGNVSK